MFSESLLQKLPPHLRKFIEDQLGRALRGAHDKSNAYTNPSDAISDLIEGAQEAIKKDNKEKVDNKEKIINEDNENLNK